MKELAEALFSGKEGVLGKHGVDNCNDNGLGLVSMF